MTQGQVKKHINEMERWAKAPDGTRMWFKDGDDLDWDTTLMPFWAESCIYIVDDEWAELRKAQADGKQLQVYQNMVKWVDDKLSYSDLETSTPEHWRIKPEIKFPVYRRSKITGIILKFVDRQIGDVVMSDGKHYEIGERRTTLMPFDDAENWEEVKTFEHEGVIYYDTQPVWSWDGDNPARYLKFIDAVNKTVFNLCGERCGATYDHYAPIECMDDWIIEVWKQLRI